MSARAAAAMAVAPQPGATPRWWSASRVGRGLVALGCTAIAGRLLFELLAVPEVLSGAGSGGSRGLAWAAQARVAMGGMAGLIAAAGLGVGMGRRPLLAGVIATCAASVALELVTFGRGRLFAETQLMLVAVAGWTLGAAFGVRAVGEHADAAETARARDAYGFEGLCGGLAAAWGLAAVSKLLDGGREWIDVGTVWHMLLASRDMAIGEGGALQTGSWLLDFVIANPALTKAMATSALVVEGAAPLLVLRGRWRRGLALLLAAMHLGFEILGGLGHLDLVALLVILAALPSEPLPALAAPRRAAPIGLGALVLVLLAWALPIDRWLALPADRRSNGWTIHVEAEAPTQAATHGETR